MRETKRPHLGFTNTRAGLGPLKFSLFRSWSLLEPLEAEFSAFQGSLWLGMTESGLAPLEVADQATALKEGSVRETKRPQLGFTNGAGV